MCQHQVTRPDRVSGQGFPAFGRAGLDGLRFIRHHSENELFLKLEAAHLLSTIGTLTDDERRSRGERLRTVLLSLLGDRFHLEVRRETRQLPVLFRRVMKGDPKFAGSDGDADVSGGLRVGTGSLAGKQTPISFFAQTLSQIVGR